MKPYGQAILIGAIKYLDNNFNDDEAVISLLDLLPDETRTLLIEERMLYWQVALRQSLGGAQ